MKRLIVSAGIILLSLAVFGTKKTPRDFELYQLDDSLFSTRKVRSGAKVLVVDFFSVFCEPCKKAIPKWEKLYTSAKEKGLELVIVALPAMDDREKEMKKMLTFFKPYSIPVVYDKYKIVGKQYGVVNGKGSAVIPQVFVLDSAGKVITSQKEAGDSMIPLVKKKLGQ